MPRYQIEQRHLTHHGRTFHFVSYEGQPAHVARGEAAVPPTWYLMNEGKRREVMPQAVLPAEEVDRLLIEWLDEHVFLAKERANGRRSGSRRAPVV